MSGPFYMIHLMGAAGCFCFFVRWLLQLIPASEPRILTLTTSHPATKGRIISKPSRQIQPESVGTSLKHSPIT